MLRNKRLHHSNLVLTRGAHESSAALVQKGWEESSYAYRMSNSHKTFILDTTVVLPSTQPLGQWAMNVSLAWEDINLANDRLLRSLDTGPVSNSLFDVKTVASLVWEVAKFFRESESDASVALFLKSLPATARRGHARVIERTDTKLNPVFAKRLVQARDMWAHYEKLGGKRLVRAMEASASTKAEVKVGTKFRDLSLAYAHRAAEELFFASEYRQGLSDAERLVVVEEHRQALSGFIKELQELVVDVLRFLRAVLDSQLLSHAHPKR